MSFTIKDFIDILLLTSLLFYMWRVMKETRSANIFVGVLIFVVSWIFLSRIFEMKLMGGIIDNLINIGALALVILFQDEIRNFFSTIGSKRSTKFIIKLFQREESTDTNTALLPLVMACMNMSKQKVGALIIIERNVGLNEVARTGETVDGKISQRLIENIFFKNSPLHDGAMIIANDRIKAAGCILPVSHDANIPKSLGLRHRSALGISQQSDAMAIIVSEETGSISAAIGGQFRLRLTPEELERLITEDLSA